jgi:tetratricopeptide (TPR) repeat protein
MRTDPLAWLHIELTKLWYTLGNDELTHDYDALGERELLGDMLPLSVPFGVLLGLGAFGLVALGSGTAQQRLLALALGGQLGAVLAANLLWFTSAQNRLPCAVPLVVAIAAASSKLSELPLRSLSRAWVIAALGCSLLCVQAFVPRHKATRPTSAHYYNLANVEEALGLYDAALAHYARASAQNPKQPMFWLRLAHLARRVQRPAQATEALDKLAALPQLSPPFLEALEHERTLLAARPR